MIGPLRGQDGPAGLLLVIAQEGRSFEAAHVPFVTALLEPISVALENDRRVHELAQLREAAEADRRALLTKLGRDELAAPIVGSETGLRSVMERVVKVAPSDVPVLLFGETGTGKEVIARAVHMQSRRAGGPFLRVNCGAIPPELIDSQLFGHEKGSFTGATDTRKGWFGRADGGTLFLDEIGDLPLAAQVRLLRVLQDGTLERVGGERALHVDVRVIGATHRDLAAMVRAGVFREDLWYRLAVFPISIPPLRERREDIPTLARHFAEKAATRFGLPLAMPTADDLSLLMSYPWPGNVRELAAVIDRAALLGNGHRLDVPTALGRGFGTAILPDEPSVSSQPAVGTNGSAAYPSVELPGVPRGAAAAEFAAESLDHAMIAHIEAALRMCHGRVEGPFGAAARLRINPHTLRSRMRRLGIDWRAFRNGARRVDSTSA
jgi:transcriptional regulator with GAF, ATPase, and Fis domain